MSVVAIRGSECRMEMLRLVPNATNGAVDIVDPSELAQHFVVNPANKVRLKQTNKQKKKTKKQKNKKTFFFEVENLTFLSSKQNRVISPFWNKPLVGTEAQLKLLAQQNVRVTFGNEAGASLVEREIGNVVNDSELYVSYQVENGAKFAEGELLHFQTQVR